MYRGRNSEIEQNRTFVLIPPVTTSKICSVLIPHFHTILPRWFTYSTSSPYITRCKSHLRFRSSNINSTISATDLTKIEGYVVTSPNFATSTRLPDIEKDICFTISDTTQLLKERRLASNGLTFKVALHRI